MNYYNEIDPFAAKWLRELIKAGHISEGEVDERSIEDVLPSDLRGFKQCHFFAGIGVWSYALRQAGWHDDREVWTGSCPCQPFSAAGKRGGASDERHLWPALFHLVAECKPRVLFGEQVASKDGLAWIDIVQTDLEVSNYAVGVTDLCAAGFGAPHIRQRLYFVANSGPQPARRGLCGSSESSCQDVERTSDQPQRPSVAVDLAHPDGRHSSPERLQRRWEHGLKSEDGCVSRSLDYASDSRRNDARERECGSPLLAARPQQSGTSFWSECDWLPCIDGKARPVEPGTFPLAHGVANRVGRLRGYGNALCAPVAQAFIEAYLESEG